MKCDDLKLAIECCLQDEPNCNDCPYQNYHSLMCINDLLSDIYKYLDDTSE